MKGKLYRIIDANLNRAREGLRVVEDVVRFLPGDKRLISGLKRMRHDIANTVKDCRPLMENRDSRNDAGKGYSYALEGCKKGIRDIVVSNFRRTEESLRVMEDISKIIIPENAGVYKRLRFRAYALEKDVYKKI